MRGLKLVATNPEISNHFAWICPIRSLTLASVQNNKTPRYVHLVDLQTYHKYPKELITLLAAPAEPSNRKLFPNNPLDYDSIWLLLGADGHLLKPVSCARYLGALPLSTLGQSVWHSISLDLLCSLVLYHAISSTIKCAQKWLHIQLSEHLVFS